MQSGYQIRPVAGGVNETSGNDFRQIVKKPRRDVPDGNTEYLAGGRPRKPCQPVPIVRIPEAVNRCRNRRVFDTAPALI